MKFEIKEGSKVKVVAGKHAGTEAAVIAVDTKNKRIKLDGVKVKKVKTKKGEQKELHGTFHVSSLQLVKEEPKTEAPAEEAKAE